MSRILARVPRKVAAGVAIPALAVIGVATGSVMSADAADPVAAMSGSPNPLTYDDVAAGSSKDATVTLRSSGTAAVVVSSVANLGRDASQYSIASDGCTGQTLAPGATCPVVLRFSPTTTKTLVTNLRFQSTNACTTYVNVAGGGTTAQTAAAARATPRAAACEVVTTPGTTTPGTTTPGSTVTVPAGTVTTTSTVTTPGSTQVSAASSSPSSTPGASTSAASTGAVAGVTAVSPKICKSRRTITFNVKPKKGTTLAKVSVRVNNKLVKVFKKPKSGKLKTQLKLTGQPRTRVKVVIRSTTTAGKASTRTQYFVTCVPKRASSN